MANVPISAFTVPANTVGIGATGYSLTGSASASFMDLAGTWNTSGTPTAIKLNITDTASNAASLLMDLGTGGGSFVSRFKVDKVGNGTFGNNLIVTNATRSDGGFNIQADAILSRRGTGNLRLGAADAASAVPQLLSVQSVVAGTTNTAGQNFTITGSQGTGTGAGGSIIFQVAPAGSSGSAQNALATALTINSAQQLLVNVGSAAAPSISFSGNTNTGIFSTGSNNISFSTGSVERFRMGSGGRFAAADGMGFGQNTAVPFSVMTSSGYGVVEFSPGSGSDTRICLGGTTSSFPALKRSSTVLQARLADDSAFASLQGKLTTETAYTAGAVVVTGYLTLYDSTGTAYRVPCLV